MTQLEKSVFGAGFVAMTEEELYGVNGGRRRFRDDGLYDDTDSSGSGSTSTETTTIESSTTDIHFKFMGGEIDYHKEKTTVTKSSTSKSSSSESSSKSSKKHIGVGDWRDNRM